MDKGKEYYENLDKRSREYKDWKALQVTVNDPVYLGDTVEKIVKATGIEKVAKLVLGKDCGCDERRSQLNKYSLPVRKKAQRCFTDEQLKTYAGYRKRRTLNYKHEDVKLLINLYAWVFAIQYDITKICVNCSGSYKIIKQIEDNLDKVFDTY